METRRFNDIAGFSNQLPQWDMTMPSSLPGWHWQIKREEVAGINCLDILLMSDDPGERSAEFQTGLKLWRVVVPSDSKGVLNFEQADLLASAKVAALEFILRSGVYQAEMDVRKEEWRKKDQEIHRLKEMHQEEMQKLQEQVAAQATALAELRDTCDHLDEIHNRVHQVVEAAKEVVTVMGAKLSAGRQRALGYLKIALSDLALAEQQEKQEVSPVLEQSGQPCKYCVTYSLLDGDDSRFQDKIKAIKAIREATGVDLQMAKEWVEEGTVFEVPGAKLQGFCLAMEEATSVKWRAV